MIHFSRMQLHILLSLILILIVYECKGNAFIVLSHTADLFF